MYPRPLGCLLPVSDQSSKIAQYPQMALQLFLDIPQEDPCALIVLFSLSGPQVNRKLVEMTTDSLPDLFVCGAARPEVRWCSAGSGRYAPKGRRAELFVFFHQDARPVLQVLKEPIEFPVYLMVLWDLSVRLLHLLHHVDDLTQDSVESSD